MKFNLPKFKFPKPTHLFNRLVERASRPYIERITKLENEITSLKIDHENGVDYDRLNEIICYNSIAESIDHDALASCVDVDYDALIENV